MLVRKVGSKFCHVVVCLIMSRNYQLGICCCFSIFYDVDQKWPQLEGRSRNPRSAAVQLSIIVNLKLLEMINYLLLL